MTPLFLSGNNVYLKEYLQLLLQSNIPPGALLSLKNSISFMEVVCIDNDKRPINYKERQ
jgi:hypothetical protein